MSARDARPPHLKEKKSSAPESVLLMFSIKCDPANCSLNDVGLKSSEDVVDIIGCMNIKVDRL